MTQHTDRELLELAAKAAGLTTGHKWNAERLQMQPPVLGMVVYRDGELVSTGWDPLTDDGDSDRLGTAIGLNVRWYGNCVTVTEYGAPHTEYFKNHNNDKQKALRWARVKCAAEIGKAMP